MTQGANALEGSVGARRPASACLGWGRRAAAASRRVRLGAGLAALMALAACGTTQQQTSGGASAPAPRVQSLEVGVPSFGDRVAVEPGERAVVALLAPMGQSRNTLDVIGRSIANGAQLALSDIGLGDLDLRLYDTGGTADGAALAAQAAARDGAAVMLGPLLSRSVSTAGPVALGAGLPVISFSTDAAVAGDNVYLIGFLPSSEMERMASFAASNGVFTFGALAPDTVEGDVLLSAFRDAATASGGEVALVERYRQTFVDIEQGARRYADAHKGIALTRPIDGVLLADGGQSLNSVAAYLPFFEINPDQSSGAGGPSRGAALDSVSVTGGLGDEPAPIKTRFLGVGKWNDPLVFREPSLRGGWFAGPDPALREQFAARYRAAFGEEPHSLSSLGYDAMAAIGAMAAEARRAGSRFPFTAEAITAPVGFVGVNGVFRFRPDGLNERGLAMLQIGRDGFIVIDPAPTGFTGG